MCSLRFFFLEGVDFVFGSGHVADHARAREPPEVREQVFAQERGSFGRGSKVPDACHGVARKDIVGADAVALEKGAEVRHHDGIVIDAPEEDALIREGNTVLDDCSASLNRSRGQLSWVVKLRLHPDASTLRKAVEEFRRPAHGEDNRGARAEANGVDLRESGKGVYPTQERVVGEDKRVASGEEDFADAGAILKHAEQIFQGGGAGDVEESAPGAVPAMGGAGG